MAGFLHKLRTLVSFAALGSPVLLLAAARLASGQSEQEREFFEKRVRPVLVEHCLPCHSSKTATSGLSLDSAAGVKKGGSRGATVVAGHPEQSLFIRAVSYEDKDLQMPPKGRLPQEQREALAQWVKMGAVWPGGTRQAADGGGQDTGGFDLAGRLRHWSWRPLARPALPGGGIRKAQSGNPIDAFIGAKLRAKGLRLSAPADRGTWIRRVTYDLTGLPPTPEEVEAFRGDRSAQAYEKVVDRLLSSPHYGERWARHWLDLARFAETDGHEFDFEKPNAFRYRDYVIRALNADVPYDQFVREHIAGDLLANPRVNLADGINESILATGFWWLGEGKHSPVDLLVDEAERVENQIDVFGKTFLGMGIACARCHDHKFDAITTKDYYALSGVLKSSRFREALIDVPGPREKLAREIDRLQGEAEGLYRAQVAAAARSRAYVTSALPDAGPRPASFPAGGALADRLREIATSSAQNPLRTIAALATDENLNDPTAYRSALNDALEKSAQATRARERVYQQSRVFEDFERGDYRDWHVSGEAFRKAPPRPAYRFRESGPALIPAGSAYSARGSDRFHGALRSATFTITRKKIHYRMAGRDARVNLIVDNFQRIRDPLYGGLTLSPRSADRFGWQSQDVSKHVGHRAYIEILDPGDGFIAVDEILFGDEQPPDPGNSRVDQLLRETVVESRASLLAHLPVWLSAMAGAVQASGDIDAIELLTSLSPTPPAESVRGVAAKLRDLEQSLPQPRYAMALDDGTGEDDRVHTRGLTTNLGERVPRRFLEACQPTTEPLPGPGSGRLEMAERMLKSALIPRVIVNRLWHHHFGAGIVKTTDDFGFMGARPTHPELLEWLAAELVEPSVKPDGLSVKDAGFRRITPPAQRWSLKHIHRLIVLSETYRQSSARVRSAESADPENRLLHRMPVRRLEAEAVRDGALAVSGRLDRTLFGPSVLPHLTPFMEGRGRPSKSGPLDGDGRRSIYLSVRRNFLTPMLLAFDYPVPFSTMGRRTVSNVPAQALTLLNNPFIVQQSEHWAKRVLSEPGTLEERVKAMYVSAFARPPDASEMRQAREYLQAQGEESPAAWADLAHVLFNVKEFIFVR